MPTSGLKYPKKRDEFYRWLDQAQKDFALYLRASRFDEIPQALRDRLGSGIVDRTMASVLPEAAAEVAAPAILSGITKAGDIDRAERAVEQINRQGSQSKPWASL